MIKTYKVDEIQSILQLSRTKTYEIVNQNLFPIIRIGKTIRIPAEPFEEWVLFQSDQDNQPLGTNIESVKAKAI